MKHLVYEALTDKYPIAILVKASAFIAQEIDKSYIQPLESMGLDRKDIIVVALEYNANGKITAKQQKEYLAELLPALESVGTRYIFCADAPYFKTLTKSAKADPHLGYVLQCAIADYEQLEVILGLNHRALLHNPNNESKFQLGLETFSQAVQGTYVGLGTNVIQSATYPQTDQGVQDFLQSLHQYPVLAADTEAFSLKYQDAGIGTIGFAWNQNEGGVFPIDFKARKAPSKDKNWGEYRPNTSRRAMLKQFLIDYQGTLLWHNGPYDLKLIIFYLWMDEDPWNINGMLEGLEVVTKNWHDTKILAYLALNSCGEVKLGLKELAHAFAGNWAVDVKDIRKHKLKDLLQYNLVDCLSTFWVYEKFLEKVIADDQLPIYQDVMMPSQKTIIQAELVGMPMEANDIQQAKKALTDIVTAQNAIIQSSQVVKSFTLRLQKEAMAAANAKLKTKQHTIEKFALTTFNPGSAQQLQKLLFEEMDLPILSYTPAKQPQADAKTLKSLKNHTHDPDYLTVLQAIMDRSEAKTILDTFIPAFENARPKGDGRVWLHGNFNLGGTVSGRLSSSKPNLQNLPSGSTFGKLVKSCVKAPDDWLYCGADFNALEDRINALLTKDPNKIKVFTDKFDSHALRCYNYWPEEFPDLDPNDPKSINLIKEDKNGKEHPLRSKSKGPSFALQYLGQWFTLVKNSGFTADEAKRIEANFLKLYKVSRDWVNDRIAQASKDGYATGAFGLRIRTPLLQRSLLGRSVTPRSVEAESRSLGNAVSGQSYGLLNNRAANAVMERVWASKHRFDILPVAFIHDAIYFIVRNNAETVTWLNKVLVEEMSWQDLPEIHHELVKLEAELDLFWPSWASKITLPNNATSEEIVALCQQESERVAA